MTNPLDDVKARVEAISPYESGSDLEFAYLLGFAEGVKLTDRNMREQIAKEIEAQHSIFCQYQVQHFKEMALNWSPDTVETFDKCSHVEDAVIARGNHGKI